MEAKYIKQEISTEICEDGGATAKIVGNKVLPLGTAVEEAISGGYAIGDRTLLTAEVMGVVRSMVENCAKDGNARQVDGLFTVSPQYYGLIDPEKGHDPAVNGVELKIRLLKELKVDTSTWTFTDVTPGKEPIKAQTVSTGDASGEVVLGAGSVIKVTGYGLENTAGVDWEVPGTAQAGTFAANKVTKSATVVTITDGLASLNIPTNDGLKIVLTVRVVKNASKVSGTMKYSPPTITKVATAGRDGIVKGQPFDIEGTNLRYNAGDTVKAKWNAGGTAGEQLLAPTAVTPTKMSFAAVTGFNALPDNTELTFEFTIDESSVSKATSLAGA